jgi:hypothetical protein
MAFPKEKREFPETFFRGLSRQGGGDKKPAALKAGFFVPRVNKAEFSFRESFLDKMKEIHGLSYW